MLRIPIKFGRHSQVPQQFSNPTRVQRSLLMGTGEYMVAWPVFVGITLTTIIISITIVVIITIIDFITFSMIFLFMITIMNSSTVVNITIRDSRVSGVGFSLDILQFPACYG